MSTESNTKPENQGTLQTGTIKTFVQDENAVQITISKLSHIMSLLNRAKTSEGKNILSLLDRAYSFCISSSLGALSLIITSNFDDGIIFPGYLKIILISLFIGLGVLAVVLFFIKKFLSDDRKSFIDEAISLLSYNYDNESQTS